MNEQKLNDQRGKKNLLWQQPKLTYLGKITDLVKGGGKTGVVIDADPQSTTKGGVG